MRKPPQLRAATLPLRAQRADDRAPPQEEEIVVFEPLGRRSRPCGLVVGCRCADQKGQAPDGGEA